jgi:hypothetical protein
LPSPLQKPIHSVFTLSTGRVKHPWSRSFQVCFTLKTPMSFYLQGFALLSGPKTFPPSILPCRFRLHSDKRRDSEGLIPEGGGAKVNRSSLPLLPSWLFSPLRLSFSSPLTRLPESSSYALCRFQDRGLFVAGTLESYQASRRFHIPKNGTGPSGVSSPLRSET